MAQLALRLPAVPPVFVTLTTNLYHSPGTKFTLLRMFSVSTSAVRYCSRRDQTPVLWGRSRKLSKATPVLLFNPLLFTLLIPSWILSPPLARALASRRVETVIVAPLVEKSQLRARYVAVV